MLDKMNKSKAIAVLGFASLLGLASSASHAGDVIWSAAGSTALVESGSQSTARTARASLTVGPVGGTVIARFPIAPTRDLEGGGSYFLRANVLDPGAKSSISISMVEVAVTSDDKSIPSGMKKLFTLQSSDVKAGQLDNACAVSEASLDFYHNTYFVQVELTTSDPTQLPSLRALQIGLGECQ